MSRVCHRIAKVFETTYHPSPLREPCPSPIQEHWHPNPSRCEAEALIIQMARENSGWAYDRIVGALANSAMSFGPDHGQRFATAWNRACAQAQPDHYLEGLHPLAHGGTRRSRLLTIEVLTRKGSRRHCHAERHGAVRCWNACLATPIAAETGSPGPRTRPTYIACRFRSHVRRTWEFSSVHAIARGIATDE
jgi:hypothetical protein